MPLTNRGRFRIFDSYLRGAAPPTSFYLALGTSATPPTVDTNTLSEVTQASGGGYPSGGWEYDRNTTDFPSLTENDANAFSSVGVKDLSVTATGGDITFLYILLTDDNATVGSREVWGYWQVGEESLTVASGATNLYTGMTIALRQFIRTDLTQRWTARGMFRVLGHIFNAVTAPTTFYVPLFTATPAPTAAINLVSDLTQIATGNGYTSGGSAVARSAVGWDAIAENDTLDFARVDLATVTYTAAGGAIPASGDPLRYAAITDDDATVADREVILWWDLTSQTIADAASLDLSGLTATAYNTAS